MKYIVILEKDRDTGYIAYVPTLKGCVSRGKTKEETLENAKKTVEVYVNSLIEDGLIEPPETGKNTIELQVMSKE